MSKLSNLLANWLDVVAGWFSSESHRAHPGRAIRVLEGWERASVQREVDRDWYFSPLVVSLRGVFVNTILTGRQTQRAALELLDLVLREGTWVVILLAFTFDREDIALKLITAASSGSAVIGVFDKKMAVSGQTRLMMGQLSRMAAGGVAVRVLEGDLTTADYEAVGRSGQNFKGIQHAKGLLVYRRDEAYALVGSCNWTTASRANSEMSLALRAKAEGAGSLLKHFGVPVIRSDDYVEAAKAAHLVAASEQGGPPVGSGQSSTGRV